MSNAHCEPKPRTGPQDGRCSSGRGQGWPSRIIRYQNLAVTRAKTRHQRRDLAIRASQAGRGQITRALGPQQVGSARGAVPALKPGPFPRPPPPPPPCPFPGNGRPASPVGSQTGALGHGVGILAPRYR